MAASASKKLLAMLLSAAVPCAQAAEADYFTARDAARALDITSGLDERANAALARAAALTSGCDESGLRRELDYRVGGMAAEEWPTALLGDRAALVPYGASIYRGVFVTARIYTPALFTLAGSLVSPDKLSHFFHTGQEMAYFVEARYGPAPGSPDSVFFRAGPDLPRTQRRFETWTRLTFGDAALPPRTERPAGEDEKTAYVVELSRMQEDGRYGMALTSVKSYADMAANLEGYRFWSDLTAGERPYFRCSEGKWTQVRRFAWADHVSDAWDEGINCSDFSEVYQETIRGRIAAASGGSSCPVEPASCSMLRSRLSGAAAGALHPACAGL